MTSCNTLSAKDVGHRLKSWLKWNKCGNKASKEFYHAKKEKLGASNITKLENHKGVRRAY